MPSRVSRGCAACPELLQDVLDGDPGSRDHRLSEHHIGIGDDQSVHGTPLYPSSTAKYPSCLLPAPYEGLKRGPQGTTFC